MPVSGNGCSFLHLLRFWGSNLWSNLSGAVHREQQAMTREQAIERLNELADGLEGIEGGHIRADEVLCDLLTALGYGDVVKSWRAVEKWYA